MKEAFEKILERLDEELRKSEERYYKYLDDSNLPCMFDKSDIEEKRVDTIKEMLEIVQEVAEEYNGGWIACSERFPDNDKKQYIVQKTNGSIDILGFTKDAYKLSQYDFAEYKGKKKQLFYDYDSEYGYAEWECEAWQLLPEPFKERD